MSLLTDHLNFGNIFFNDKTYSPDTILANIDAVAENLTKRFISNSPFVYLFAPNHIKTVFGLFGILKAGRICVLVDPALGHFEIEEMIKDAAPGAIIRIDKSTDIFDFFKEIEVKHYQLSQSRLQGLEDVAIMLYTAADDGFAKGVMLTHENLLASSKTIINSIDLNKKTVSCSPISFHHLFALQSGVISPSLAGGTVVIEEIVSPGKTRDALQVIADHAVTHLQAIPLVYYLLCKEPQIKEKLGSIRLLISGGYKLSPMIANRFKKNTGIDIWEGYGLTETSLAITWHKPSVKVNIASVGIPLPCCEIKILTEDNVEIPVGKIGEICARGPIIMKGYYQNEVTTKKIISNGWLHTGDLGKMDDQGFIYLAGLKKRMLNVAGNKVYPAELERLIHKNDNVWSIEVFGEPDELMGDKVKARVHLQKNTKDDQKLFEIWCSDNITRYKVPRSFEYV